MSLLHGQCGRGKERGKSVKNMRLVTVIIVLFVALCDASEDVEPRGKKKLWLFIYIADLVVKKIFILKVIYAFAFWVLLHKAGYFVGWLVSYLKDQKHYHHDHHDHHDHHTPHYEYGPPGPYRRKNPNGNGQYSAPYRTMIP